MYKSYTNCFVQVKVIIVKDKEIMQDLLRKFYRHNAWGRHHFREDTIVKGFSSHLRKNVIRVAEDLRRRGFMRKFPTNHGIQWYANIEKLKEIEEIIKE